MQGKGLIKVLFVALAIVCLLQYLYTLPTARVEAAAEAHAEAMAAGADEEDKNTVKKEAQAAFLDSMSSEVVWGIPLLGDFTYQELKNKQLAYGLDLQGGMSVVLEVDLREFIRSLARDSKDPTFVRALEKAAQDKATSQTDFVTLFSDAYNELSAGQGKLATIFANSAIRDEVTFESSNADIIRILRDKSTETVGLTYKRLKDRIDELGVVQPNVSLDAARDLIVVELPGIANPERARQFLQSTAELAFWDVYQVTDPGILQSFLAADDKLKQLGAGGEVEEDSTLVDETATVVEYDTTWEYTYDETGNVSDSSIVLTEKSDESIDPLADAGPLLSEFTLNASTGTTISFPRPVMGLADKNKIDYINKMLNNPEVKKLFPSDVMFLWSKEKTDYIDEPNHKKYELYAVKKQRGTDKAPIEGDRVTRASSGPDPQTGEIQVSLMMDPTGSKKWADMTTKAAQDNNRAVAIVLDNRVVSAPSVNGPILGGSTAITGNFSVQEGDDLAKILQIGKLPAKTKIIQESLVGPSLGKANIASSINALLIGFGLVLLFMLAYYAGGGLVAILALFLNIIFIFGSLASYGTVLTLPGIAGIVLTIGMAVDANVIIFERIREELREGKSVLASIQDGFKHSYSAIIDANVTTLLTAFILAYFGLGPIKGFAVVLIIGVLMSLFTAVLVGRMMIDWWTIGRGKDLSFWTGFSKNAFAHLNVDWMGKRKVAYVISGVLLLASIGSFFTRGFELGVDFKGGYSYNVQIDESSNVDADALRTALSDAFGSTPVVKEVNTDNTYNVTTSYLINDQADDAQDRVLAKLHEGINGLVGGNLTLDNFKDSEFTGTHVTQSSKVGPTIADDIRSSAWKATIFALLLIFGYIMIRFTRWQYSAGAVAALFHDTIIVMGIFSMLGGVLPFSMEIDQAFIAAILTVIGYSINDTVVVFDRIREYLNNYTEESKEQVINRAVNSTLSRTVITSLTTLFVVGILLVFGGASIKGFAFALLVGIIVGTYSSVFVATPIMSDLSGELKAKQTKKKSSFSKASV